MKNKIAIIAGALTVGLLITGIAFAAQDAGSAVNVSLAESQTVTLPVDDAGVVVLSRSDGQLAIVSATPNTGYQAEVEVASGREVEADFTGNGVKVKFNAELEDGVVKVRITSEDSDVASASGATSTTNRSSTTSQTSTTGSNSTPATTASTGSGTSALADGQTNRIVVANAGAVLLRRNGGTLTIVSTESNPGWTVEVEVATGREVEGDFRNGGLRVKFNFELEDGVIRTEIETESETGTTGSTNTTATTSPTATTSTTPTTSPTSTTNTTGGSSIPDGSVTYNLDGAGTVTIIFANGGMSIGSINPAAGWIVDKSDQTSDEIEVELVLGEAEVELNLHITGGQLVVQIIRT
jgi:hypothetical protein